MLVNFAIELLIVYALCQERAENIVILVFTM